jgi:hypothetical protein
VAGSFSRARARREQGLYAGDEIQVGSEPFEFSDERSGRSDEFAAEVPAGLAGADALLRALCDALRLPGWFGFNWNALSECLRDLDWLPQRSVVLRHVDLPALPTLDLQNYVGVLADAVASWTAPDEHQLRIVFPSHVRHEVLRALAAGRRGTA